MQDPAESELFPLKNSLGAFEGKITDSDEPLGLEDSDDFTHVFVASGEQCRAF